MFGPPPLITFITQLLKLPNNLWKVLNTDISNGIPCLFVFLWPCFGLETHRGNQPLSWSPPIIFWLWRCDSCLVHNSKLQQYFQGDLLVTTLDLPVFHNIDTNTIFHVHSLKSFPTCELFLPERLPCWANMINRQWCYNFWEIHVHNNICITNLWSVSSYSLYSHGFLVTLSFI